MRPVEVNALLEAEKVAEATKLAIKRKIAQAASVDFQSRTMPAKLRINPEDPEDVVSGNPLYGLLSLFKILCKKCSYKWLFLDYFESLGWFSKI